MAAPVQGFGTKPSTAYATTPPDLVLEKLKTGAGSRTVRNLEKIHGGLRLRIP